ncbi:hypothetical protein CU663_20045, partial [Pseudomonas syringae pv. actinidifoliorum]|nr:hypothetical protein [Pseudomonas syringae pv. actinidifoliorum]
MPKWAPDSRWTPCPASILWALLAATGLGLVFEQLPWLQPALQLLGGAYLAWLGDQKPAQRGQPAQTPGRRRAGHRQPEPRLSFRPADQPDQLPRRWRFTPACSPPSPRRACRCGCALRGCRSLPYWQSPGSCCWPRCFRSLL